MIKTNTATPDQDQTRTPDDQAKQTVSKNQNPIPTFYLCLCMYVICFILVMSRIASRE